MNNVERLRYSSVVITQDEWLVIAVVVLGLAAFELGPKLLNFIKNRRSRKAIQKN